MHFRCNPFWPCSGNWGKSWPTTSQLGKMRRAKTRTALLRPLRLAHWPQSTVLVVRPHLKDTEEANIVQNISDDLDVFLREINIEKIAVSVVLGFFKQLKGQCHEIFCFLFFFKNQFPPAPEYTVKTVSNFFENSLRYSQVKVHHQYQRHQWQIFISTTPAKMVKNFCCEYQWHPPAANLPPVSTTPAPNFSTIFASVVDTGGKVVNDAGSNLPPVSMTPAGNLPLV